MSTEENKAILRRLHDEAYNKGNLAVVDELVGPDWVRHHPARIPPTPDYGRGPNSVKQLIVLFRNAFPDGRVSIEEMVAEEDKVAFRWVARGTHTGEYFGFPPTGKPVEFAGTTIERFSGSKMAESWGNWDTLALFQQLGLVPETSELLRRRQGDRG